MTTSISNGRLAAIFFTALNLSASAQTIDYLHDSLFSRGGLSAGYWAQQDLTSSPSRVAVLDDVRVRLSAEVGDHHLWLEKRALTDFRGNGNVLSIAARDAASIQSGQGTSIPLEGVVRQYELDAIGLRLQHALSQSWTLSWTPQLLFLKNYSETKGRGDLTSTATTAAASGQFNRLGMSSYGFALDSQDLRFEPGWSMDVGSQYLGENVTVDLLVQNLSSTLPAQGIYYSQRQYNVSAQGGKINLSDTPSLSGTYGQKNINLSLPRVTQINLGATHLPGVRVGVVAIENDAIPVLTYASTDALPGASAQMIGDGNWRLNYALSWLRTKASVSVTWAAGLAPIWQLNALSLSF